MDRAMSLSYISARDGTPIAFKSWGAGTALIYTNGFTASDFYWRHLFAHFEGRAQQVVWDLKGHGLSGPARTLDAVTVEDSVDDLRRVMDAAGVERAVLLAFSLGCQIILEAWRQLPQRITALVPILGTYGRPLDNLIDPRFGALAHAFMQRLPGRLAGLGLKLGGYSTLVPGAFALSQLTGSIGRRATKRDMRPFFEHMRHIDGSTWRAMGLAAQGHSAEDVLESIEVPTLIVAGGRDTFTPVRLGEEMARRIPGAEYHLIPDGYHTGLLEDGEEIAGRVERFLGDHDLLSPPR